MVNKSSRDERGRNGMRTHSSNNSKSVCVDVGRVLDSCSDRDCIDGLRVYFSPCDQQRVDDATGIRAKGAKVISTFIDVEPLPFREGCYSCKIMFYIEVELELSGEADAMCGCNVVCGCVTVEKKVILYGGEGNVQVFSGDLEAGNGVYREMAGTDMPKCCVQVAQPVMLDVALVDACGCGCHGVSFPECVSNRFMGKLSAEGGCKTVLVTIGMFTIVQMTRRSQMLIPAYDYCLPCKECGCDEQTPCELFKKMSFPVEDFFPPMDK